jgi:hypothetical protein
MKKIKNCARTFIAHVSGKIKIPYWIWGNERQKLFCNTHGWTPVLMYSLLWIILKSWSILFNYAHIHCYCVPRHAREYLN